MKTEAQKAAKAEANRRYRENVKAKATQETERREADARSQRAVSAVGEAIVGDKITWVSERKAAKAARIAKEAADKAAARNARHVAAKAAPVAETAKTAAPATGKRAAILASAQAGVLPTKPDFSADTHKPYRKHLDALVALVEGGDVAGLKGYPINPVSTSPKALDRYRNLAVTALEARAAKTETEAAALLGGRNN